MKQNGQSACNVYKSGYSGSNVGLQCRIGVLRERDEEDSISSLILVCEVGGSVMCGWSVPLTALV